MATRVGPRVWRGHTLARLVLRRAVRRSGGRGWRRRAGSPCAARLGSDHTPESRVHRQFARNPCGATAFTHCRCAALSFELRLAVACAELVTSRVDSSSSMISPAFGWSSRSLPLHAYFTTSTRACRMSPPSLDHTRRTFMFAGRPQHSDHSRTPPLRPHALCASTVRALLRRVRGLVHA